MKITFLGTGAGVPSKERNVTAVALDLLQEENHIWLFDCGEATQHQILHTSIRPRKINKIFITHLHGDHIFGLPGLLSSRSFQGGEEPLTVYGPQGLKQFIETTLQISKSHLTYPLHIKEIEDGSVINEVNFTIHTKLLEHGIESYGYRIVEKDTSGELLVDKLKALGISPGPIYGEIKANEYINLESYGRIYRKDFVGPDKPGRIVTIMGDTRYNEEHVSFVQNSDLLVHEATFNAEQSEMAYKYYHTTTVQAAQLARAGNVKRLILTHISSRFQKEDYNKLLIEAKEVFPETELAKDLYKTEIE